MKKPVIIFPFWCQDEVDQFYWMLERWDTLTKTNQEYEFLLACRFDFDGDTARLKELCEIHAVTTETRLGGTMTGHPAGCNEMWEQSMRHLSVRGDISFAFFMEYDVVPQDSNWLNWLVDRWRDELYLMGHYVSEEWLNENGYPDGTRIHPIDWGMHINGAGCYNCRKVTAVLDKHTVRDDMAWDVQLSRFIDEPYLQIDNLTMYEFRLGNAESHQRDVNLMMVHGAKTILSKEQIVSDIEDRDLPNLISQHREPFNGDLLLQGMVYGLIQAYNIFEVVETGSFVGTTTKWLSENVDYCHGIEVEKDYYEQAKVNAPEANVVLGRSVDVLPDMIADLGGRILFFLDSHWKNEWPLLDELRIIGESKHASRCVIVIHDYKTGDLGYDRYGGRVLDEDYVRPVLESHFPRSRTFTNKDAVGSRRGVLVIMGEQL